VRRGQSVMSWRFATLAVVTLASCAPAGLPQHHSTLTDKQTDQAVLAFEAVIYRRCMEDNHYVPERCTAEREAYETDRATLQTKYGRR
jgi:hypothetical protein